MPLKPTYEELLQKVKALEKEKRAWMRDESIEARDFVPAEMGSVEKDIDSLEGAGSLGSIIDIEEIQSIMDDFHNLTGMVTAILDMNGNVIEATGWQDICTKFHRVNPKTAKNCIESDLYLVKNIKPGEYKEYQCKNGLWDIVTPLYIGNKHMGNIYTGQFFYDDDSVDEKRFIQQAEVYGFDKDAYLEAFHRIPRYSREVITHLMRFLVRFTSYISSISYSKIKLEREIRDRKRAEEEQKKLHAQLTQAQKMEAIGTLAGGIAHDFNNILSAIFGHTEIALKRTEPGSDVHNRLKEILKAGERARNLVKQILNFSRQGAPELMPLQLTPVIKEVIKFIRASLPTSIEIRQEFVSDPIMLADITQIHQVIMNLCTNAAHAMQDSGGILEIRLESVELDSEFTARHSGLQPGVYVKLTVCDTGPGMSPKLIDRIFDPFFTTKSKNEGTGMGLSVAHGIVTSHNGAITVYSTPGKGSVFAVFFPAIERRASLNKRTEKVIAGGTERILFIDDEASLVELGITMLGDVGYNVTGVKSSIEALELFEKKPDRFDLIITDLTMPQMTGDHLAKKLMKIKPDIPVILCTGFSASMDRDRAMEMGIRAFVNKPILRHQLLETIRDVLDNTKRLH